MDNKGVFLRIISSIRIKITLILLFFTLLIILIPVSISIPNTSDLLVISTVLLAILYGFYVATTFTNYTKLQSLVAEETGKLMGIRYIIMSIEPKLVPALDNAIDQYLITTFDFELFSVVENSRKEFNQVIKVTDKVKNKESNNFATLLSLITDLMVMSQDFDLAAKRVMGIADWIVMIILVALNIFLLYVIRNSSIVSSLVTIFFSTNLVVLLLLLNSVDNNTFAEEKFYNGYQRVFKEMGKLPYYTETSIQSGRIKEPQETYRIGRYTDIENSFDKEIEVVKIS